MLSTISESNKSPPTKSLDYERLLIRSLEDRITSLERQLAYKQSVIEKLLESLRLENKAPPMLKVNSIPQDPFQSLSKPLYRDLQTELGNVDVSNYEAFETAFKKVVSRHAPLKKKYVRANDAPFMTKALWKAVMLRSRLRNKYNQNKVAENWNNFHRQRNLCFKLFRQKKKRYYKNLDVILITDNKIFW